MTSTARKSVCETDRERQREILGEFEHERQHGTMRNHAYTLLINTEKNIWKKETGVEFTTKQ
jgi:hypothetical protein